MTARLCLSLLLSLFAAGCALTGERPPPERPPIVFMHGNGDNASIWLTTLWRFESNGWPRERLFTVDAAYPLARSADDRPQAGRSSAAENTQELAREVERALAQSGARQVILVGNSRGGYAIRDYIRNGGAAKVSKAILGGVPNHGVYASDSYAPQSEFNGKGPFLTALNAPQGPDGLETTPGVAFLTLRSDRFDKYAQPDGAWSGQPGKPTNVSFDGPALKGAENVVLPGRDHRETSFHQEAFAQTWRFIAGSAPALAAIVPEPAIVLDGRVLGMAGAELTNLPLPGARVQVYEVDPASGERRGAALHDKVAGADGRWGPLRGKPDAYYELVLSADGYATTHFYRSPFPRSSAVVHLRPQRLAAAERDGSALVSMTRPRGYFGLGRDRVSLDGKSPPDGIPAGVPGIATVKVKLPEAAPRTVVAECNGERIALRSWSSREGHVAVAEFHY